MELDYPVNHPASGSYKGQPYTPPLAPYALDYDPSKPGAGVRTFDILSTPDGMRAKQNAAATDLQELAMVGSLPPLVDPETGKELELTPPQLAHIYAVRKGLTGALAQEVTDKYKLAPEPGHSAEPGQPQLSPEQQAIMYIVSLGYTPERAKQLFDKYGVPSVLADKEADAHR